MARPGFIAGFLFIGLFGCCAAASNLKYGVYRSADRGHSWSPVGRGLPPDLRIDALGQSGNRRLAGTERGVYVSADEGLTWTRPERGVPESLKVSGFATLGERVYAATQQGVWVSTDQGQTWTSTGADLARVNVLSLGVAKGRLFAGSDQRGIFLLADGPDHWEQVSAGLPEGAQVFQFAVQSGQVFAALYARGIVRFDPVARQWVEPGKEYPLSLVATEQALFSGRNPGGVYTSTDGGVNWREASLGLPIRAPTWCLAQVGSVVLIGTSGSSGLLRTEDGGQQWTPSDRGLPRGGEVISLGVTETSLLAVVISGQRPAVTQGTFPFLPNF